MAEPTLDLITIGRVSVDLYGGQVGGRLEDMASFNKYVGGCPANIAVGAARLGLRSALLSRVGDEAMGRFIREQLAREGVDTSHLMTDPQRLTALVILGIRDRETFPLIFFRENCADMALTAADFAPEFIASARAIVVTGTHFSTPSVAEASMAAIAAAKAAGSAIILDIDYRPVLWGLGGHGTGEVRFVDDATVTKHLQSILPHCTAIVGTEEEIHIAGGATETIAALRQIRAISPALIVLKRGARGAAAFPGSIPRAVEDAITASGFPIEVYNVLGAGDAFLAGFLRGYLQEQRLERALSLGNAAGAIVVSRHGCAPAMPTWPELEHFLSAGSSHRALRHDPVLDQIHWATTRRPQPDELTVLAFDHRSQLERLADKTGRPRELIARFKQLVYEGAREAAGDCRSFGIILDHRYGQQTLDEASGDEHFIARPIELPETTPLAFEGSDDVAVTLQEWPVQHVVKCLVRCHPNDDAVLREQQEQQLKRLFSACRATGHELLLEVIPTHGAANDAAVLARLMRWIYGLGLAPDWWKLAGPPGDEGWAMLSAAIGDNDDHCRGILLLGLDAPESEMTAVLAVAARQPLCKGFAIGRTIFGAAASAWMNGTISDEQAMSSVAGAYRRMIEGWRRAREGVER
jgi:5-dehydro-2-deoxygluconokinase